jgi:ssDNA-binding Zn-finger/Zn-ribbon topoisomerase 1
MVVLFNRGGAYLGCSRYPDCSNNVPLSGVRSSGGEMTEHMCRAKDASGKLCGRPMERKVNRWGRPFLACTGYKEKACKGAVSLSTKEEPLWPVETSVACPNCGRLLNVKRSRRGKFLACPGFPKCRGTLNPPACPHESRAGKLCGLPMTEPAPDGMMRCREHPESLAAPAPARARTGAGSGGASGSDGEQDPGDGRTGAADEGKTPAARKARPKAGKRKPSARKPRTGSASKQPTKRAARGAVKHPAKPSDAPPGR